MSTEKNLCGLMFEKTLEILYMKKTVCHDNIKNRIRLQQNLLRRPVYHVRII